MKYESQKMQNTITNNEVVYIRKKITGAKLF